jgi:ABC-2 type transport system ATP-binding protein
LLDALRGLSEVERVESLTAAGEAGTAARTDDTAAGEAGTAAGTADTAARKAGTAAREAGTAVGEADIAARAADTAAVTADGRGEMRLRLYVSGEAPQLLAPVAALLHKHGMQLSAVEIGTPTLEDVFIHLTGRKLR